MGIVVGYVGKPRERTAQDRLMAEDELRWYFQDAELMFNDLVTSFGAPVASGMDAVGMADKRHANYSRYIDVREKLDRIGAFERRVLHLRFVPPEEQGQRFRRDWVDHYGDLAGIVRDLKPDGDSKAEKRALARLMYQRALEVYLEAAWVS